eukprot:TRINITY_DN23597_c0_g1_i1.p1 TRINITY_DN23597_c0_g1~~TRINITY_DN23597_c0_g1_i1.p1  ORF type:complete len:117 (+),score=5.58 TRINITY_DN23597_c0_g1_i1:205-555(+)
MGLLDKLQFSFSFHFCSTVVMNLSGRGYTFTQRILLSAVYFGMSLQSCLPPTPPYFKVQILLPLSPASTPRSEMFGGNEKSVACVLLFLIHVLSNFCLAAEEGLKEGRCCCMQYCF